MKSVIATFVFSLPLIAWSQSTPPKAQTAQEMKKADMLPARTKSGDIHGFKVQEAKTGSVYDQIGLKKGDVVKSVNGQPVDSPAKAMELYNSIKSTGTHTLLIERNGKEETIQIQSEKK